MSMMTTNDGLVLDVANVVLENPYNDYEGLYTHSNVHDSNVDLEKDQDQYDMEL